MKPDPTIVDTILSVRCRQCGNYTHFPSVIQNERRRRCHCKNRGETRTMVPKGSVFVYQEVSCSSV